MRYGMGWSTFFPVLIKAVQQTNGPVLELGSGLFSTPLLHWFCRGRKLVTYEDCEEYYRFARRFRTDTHEVKFVKNWDKEDFDKIKWDVVLVDHGTSRRNVNMRGKHTLRLKDSAKYIIIHDTQDDRQVLYGLDKVWPEFKFIYHDKSVSPQTSVVSNLKELSIFQ